MKRLTLLAAVAMLAGVSLFVPQPALGDGFLDTVLSYSFESGSTTRVYVSGMRTSVANVTIPSTVTYEYTDYNDKDDEGHYKIKHRTCAVTGIGKNAFYDCHALQSVTLPSSITSIGDFAFRNCSGLTDISLSAVRSIGNDAFENCVALTQVDLTATEYIGTNAFYECDGLTAVSTGWRLRYMCWAAFRDCVGLNTATINGDGTLFIENGVFDGCTNLETAIVGSGVAGIVDGYKALPIGLGPEYHVGMFTGCSRLKTAIIRTTRLGKIPAHMFYNTPVEHVYIAGGVKDIGDEAFRECGSLIWISGDLSAVTNVGSWVFQDCSALTAIPVMNDLKAVGNYAFQNCSALMTFPATCNLTTIGSSAFRNCWSLTNTIDLTGIESVAADAFRDCSGVRGDLVMPAVRMIESMAFAGCWNLARVSTGRSLYNLGGGAFSYCSNLTYVEIDGNGELSIPYLFEASPKLAECVLGDGVTNIADHAFSGCTNLTSVTLGSGMNCIGAHAFGGCSALTNVLFKGTPPDVGNSPFSGVKYGVAVGKYLPAYSSEWEAVIDANGYWNRLRMFNLWHCTVTMYANGGVGTKIEQSFVKGRAQKLAKNTYFKYGHLFRGWATSPARAAAEEVDYADEQSITVDSDMTLYAVWASPALTLAAESADWAEGSLTLRCTDADTSGAEHTYTLWYRDEMARIWMEVVDEYDTNSVVSATGTAMLIDRSFSARHDGNTLPVTYRVQDENGRVSAECVTRTRHGLAVGLGAYDSKVYKRWKFADLPQCRSNAQLASEVMTQRGGRIESVNMKLLTDENAKVKNISDAWQELAGDKVKPGDVIFFFLATHGSSSGAVLAYDDLYTMARFQKDLEPFRAGAKTGVKVVILLLSCHAEAMTSAERDINYEYGSMCTANIIYVAVADSEEVESAILGDDNDYTIGGEFFINQGMKNRRADRLATLDGIDGSFGNQDGRVDLLECTRYMRALVVGKSDRSPTHVQYDPLKSDLMSNTVIVTSGTSPTVSALPTPQITEVSWVQFHEEVKVCWESIDAAQYYMIYYLKEGETNEHWVACDGGWRSAVGLKTADVATAKIRKSYVPLENDAKYSFSMVAVNAGGRSPRSGSVEMRTPAASRKPMYRVALATEGGKVSPAFKDIEDGSPIGPLPIPTRPGRSFQGWFTDRVGGVEINETDIVVKDLTCYAHWSSNMIWFPVEWLRCYPSFAICANSDVAVASEMMAENGSRTVGECYALGIDPEDPNDDLRITGFRMDGNKPVMTLNHTKDGSGNSFESRVKPLGKEKLSDAEWQEVPDAGNPAFRFFKVTVEMP